MAVGTHQALRTCWTPRGILQVVCAVGAILQAHVLSAAEVPVPARAPIVLVNAATGSFLEARATSAWEGTGCPLLDAAFRSDHQVFWGLSRQNDPSPFGLGLTMLATADALRNETKKACWHKYATLNFSKGPDGAWSYREDGLLRRTVGAMGELAGGTGFAYEPLIRELRKRGYIIGDYNEQTGDVSGDIFGVPYDWRLDFAEHAVDDSPFSHGTFKRLKGFVEALVSTTSKRVRVVSHSMGSPFFHAFLHGYVSGEWTQRHIELHVALEGAWAGSPKATGIVVSGMGLQEEGVEDELAIGRAAGFLFHALLEQLSADLVQPAVSSWGALFAGLGPAADVPHGENPAVAEFGGRGYTPGQMGQFYEDIGMPQGAAIIARNQRYLNGFRAPPVSTHCFYGTGLPSPRSWRFTGQDMAGERLTGPGDSVVDHRSLSVCRHWEGGGGFDRTWEEFTGVPHGNMTFNRPVIRKVLPLLVLPRVRADPAEATVDDVDASLVCESDLTKTDQSASCQYAECSPIRNAVCVEGRCQCASGFCSDMSDPDAPLGMNIGGLNALPVATCVLPSELNRVHVPVLEITRDMVEKSGAVVALQKVWHINMRMLLVAAGALLCAIFYFKRRAKAHTKTD